MLRRVDLLSVTDVSG